MNLQSHQTLHPTPTGTILVTLTSSNFTVATQKVYLSRQLPPAIQTALSTSRTPQCVPTLPRSQPVPIVVRQTFRDSIASQNVSNRVVLSQQLPPAIQTAPSISRTPQCVPTLPRSQPVPMVVRQPFRDLTTSQNVSNRVVLQPQSKQIPKQHPLDKELYQAKIISESVKSTCHQVPLDQSPNDEDEFSEEEFMPRRTNQAGSNTDAPKTVFKRKASVCRLKKDNAKDLIAEAEEKSLSDEFSKVHVRCLTKLFYVVTECTSLENSTWKATIRANIGSRQEAETWLTEFERENSLDFRFRKSVGAEDSKRLVFKRQYRCHHNTMPQANVSSKTKKSKNFQSKNTNCPAYVRITVKHKTMKWSSDYLLQAYPCEIVISHNHNHPIICANALRRRRPCEVIRDKFTNLLQKGYSPLAALECHKYDLQTEYGDDYYKVSADQSLCPSNFWVYKLYKKLCIKNYGPQTGDDMIDALKKFCEDYNKECQSECAKVVTTEGHLAVASCTPLMKRASTLLKAAAEIMFVDSSGTMDSLNCKLFLLQTTSVAGGVPIGALIVTSERESVLNVALDLWKSMLPQDAFYGRGPDVGPKLIMTDDCPSERNALHAAFMASILLLCLFHILQAFWRYIWNREQNVKKEDRGEVFFYFRDVVYAETEEIFLERLECARNNQKLKQYPKVLSHLESYIPRAPEWALCYRTNLLTRGNDTNNYSEAGIKVFKDKVLQRTKAFNPVHLSELIVTRYDAYLKRRRIDVINNRASNVFKSRFYVRPEKLEGLACNKLDSLPNTYLVKNTHKGTEYVVVMDLEICSCPAGQSGAPCKHLSAVVQKFQLTSSLVHPILQCSNPTLKKILFEVVHGHQNVPNDWFADLVQHENLQDACTSSVAASMDVAIEGHLETECREMNDGDANENLNPQISDEDLQTLDDSLDAIFGKYKEGIRENPQFVDAIKVFISQNEKLCHSESGLLSALHTFGKTTGPLPLGFAKKKSGPDMPVQPSSKASPLGFAMKRSGPDMPVQPGSKARRTVYIGGSKAQFTGRPPTAMISAPSMQDEHSYVLPKKPSVPDVSWHKLPTRVYPAPHALLQCVTNNRMIGSNHSRK